MSTRWYRSGLVDVTDGSKNVAGAGTLWVNGNATKPEAGDIFTVDFKSFYEIEAITDDGALNLFSNYSGATATGQTYAIIRNNSANLTTRIANLVTQALNQKQQMLSEFDRWLTEQVVDPVPIHDSLGNELLFKPLPILVTQMTKLIDDAVVVLPDLVAQAQAARDLARRWASDPEDTEVETGLYSSFHYSRKSSASATESANSAGESANSATEAKTSETNSKTSETNSATSETNAKTSETNAEGFRDEAETFKDEAEASATSAAASAVAAAGSETKAEQWANFSFNNVVPGETEYSSKHYSRVAFDEAERARQYADALNATLVYQGTWNPSSGSYPPDQPSGFVGTQFYIVNTDATFDSINWTVGDNIVWNAGGSSWDRVPAAQVYSVNGKRGVVTLNTDDIPFDNTGTNLTGTTTDAVLKELDNRAESSTTHNVSANYTIATSDLENFTYTVLNLSGGGYTVTIPDYQAPFSAVIELIPTTGLTAPVTLVAGGAATIISGDITMPTGQYGYVRLILAGSGPRGNVWIPNSGRYIGSDFSSGLARATSFDASGATHAVPGDDVQTSLAAVLAGRLVDAVDADTLDGKHAAAFGELATANTWAGANTFTEKLLVSKNVNYPVEIKSGSTNLGAIGILFDGTGSNSQPGYFYADHRNANSGPNGEYSFHLDSSQSVTNVILHGAGDYYVGSNKVWHAGNDGAGSGLDADRVDGLHAAQFVRSDAADSVSARTSWTNTDSIKVPAGTESQRTPSPVAGDFRYNSDSDSFEGYTALGWGAIAGGSGRYTYSNTSQTVEAGEAYVFDMSGGALSATLPATGKVGDSCSVGILGTADNTLTISSTLPIMGVSESYTLDTDYATLTFAYINDTFGWKIVYGVGESEAPQAVQGRISNWFDAGTSVFTLTHDLGFVDVRINGDVMTKEDYSSNGTTITLTTPLARRSYVDIIAWNHVLTTQVTAGMVGTAAGSNVQGELDALRAKDTSLDSDIRGINTGVHTFTGEKRFHDDKMILQCGVGQGNGNAHFQYSDANGITRALLYSRPSGASSNPYAIRVYSANAATYKNFEFSDAGHLALPADPTTDSHAVRKRYVDGLFTHGRYSSDNTADANFSGNIGSDSALAYERFYVNVTATPAGVNISGVLYVRGFSQVGNNDSGLNLTIKKSALQSCLNAAGITGWSVEGYGTATVLPYGTYNSLNSYSVDYTTMACYCEANTNETIQIYSPQLDFRDGNNAYPTCKAVKIWFNVFAPGTTY